MKRSTQAALGLGLGAGAVALLAWAFLPAPLDVEIGSVGRGHLAVTVDQEGKTRVRERYEVSAPLAGRLARIVLHPGDPVVAGKTLLAAVDPSEPQLLDARAVAEAEARARAAEAARDRAVPQLRGAMATHELAETNYARVRRLAEKQASSHQDIDDAEQRLKVAAEDVKAAQFAVRIAEFELEQARAALVRTRPTAAGSPDPGRFEIRAPADGRVLRVFQESEAAVAPGTRLLEVGDPSDLEVEVDVLSAEAVKIAPGARAVLEHWGGEAPLSGRVRLVEPSAFTKVSALGVEEQRVNVLIDIADPPGRRTTLGDAFRVEARVVVWEEADVLKVPAGALFREGGEWAVFRVEGGRARLRPVKAGRSDGIETQILDGLREGDRVILHPSDRIRDGVSVRPARS